MKISIYELLGMIKDGKAPKKFIYDNQLFILDEEDNVYRSHLGNRFGAMYQLDIKLNDEIEILEGTLEEEKKFTKEDFIKQRMELDGITRKQFDERYEVKECNCGMPYCRGFIAVEKQQEEKKIPEKIEFYIDTEKTRTFRIISPDEIAIKINEIIDYLKSKGE